jgi:hypothetical protein
VPLCHHKSLHTHLHLHGALTRRTNRRSLRNFQKPMFFRKSGPLDRKVQSLRWLVAGLSPRMPGLDLSSVHVRFVVDKLALVQFFSEYFGLSPVSIIPAMFHTHLHLLAALTRKTNGWSLGTFQKAMVFRKSGSIG